MVESALLILVGLCHVTTPKSSSSFNKEEAHKPDFLFYIINSLHTLIKADYSLIYVAACSENLSNISGYFFSPSFPGYYLDDIFCTWRINVPDGNIIRLTFHEFRLTDHPTCVDCFLEFFDGRDETAPTIGRFCGYSYPPVFVSSSNHLTVVLRCHGKPPIARFKAFYQSDAGM